MVLSSAEAFLLEPELVVPFEALFNAPFGADVFSVLVAEALRDLPPNSRFLVVDTLMFEGKV